MIVVKRITKDLQAILQRCSYCSYEKLLLECRQKPENVYIANAKDQRLLILINLLISNNLRDKKDCDNIKYF